MAKKSTPEIPVNPTLPKVSIEVDGTKYYLCFDFNALITAEEATGINLLRQSLNYTEMSSKALRALLYAALLKAQPDITLAKAGSLITPATLAVVYPALVEAWYESMPKPEGTETKNVQVPESK